MVIYVDRVINMPIHYTFNIVFCKYRIHPTHARWSWTQAATNIPLAPECSSNKIQHG